MIFKTYIHDIRVFEKKQKTKQKKTKQQSSQNPFRKSRSDTQIGRIGNWLEPTLNFVERHSSFGFLVPTMLGLTNNKPQKFVGLPTNN